MEGAEVASSGPAGTTRSCVGCGRSIPWEANVCPYCGHDYRISVSRSPPQKQSSVPIIAGILILLSGLAALAFGVLYLALDSQDLEDSGVVLPEDIAWDDIDAVMDVCGAIAIVFGLLAILGGVMSARRKYFALSMLGGVFGVLGVGFGIGALLAIIGLILLLVSRKEFS